VHAAAGAHARSRSATVANLLRLQLTRWIKSGQFDAISIIQYLQSLTGVPYANLANNPGAALLRTIGWFFHAISVKI
jgi:hypothetical protein